MESIRIWHIEQGYHRVTCLSISYVCQIGGTKTYILFGEENLLPGGEIFYLEEKGRKTFSVRRVVESWPSMAQPLTLETKQPSNVATDSGESNVAMDLE